MSSETEKATEAAQTMTKTPEETKKARPAKKSAKAKPKTASKKKATSQAVSYSNETPTGLMPVGTTIKYLGGSKLKNKWLKKGAVGRVFGYRPGRTGGGLYAVRFEKGTTLLSVKRVERAPAPTADK